MANSISAVVSRLQRLVNRQRLVDTAVRLVNVPSRTGEAKAVSDELETILDSEGFRVERPIAGYPNSPAIAVRYGATRPGKILQFDGHLDTVHLPFVPAHVEGDRLTGSGSSDMKAGVAAAVEALRILRESELLTAGGVLFTAHDLHESPWGDGRQLDTMIREGYCGDAALIPEYLNHCIPTIGRGAFIWKATCRRPGPPVHEVFRPSEPSVIQAGAELAARIDRLHQTLAHRSHPAAGSDSLFIGQIHAGEIYNQYPQTCWLEGTRRWLPGTRFADTSRDFRTFIDETAHATGTAIDLEITPVREAFELDPLDPFVAKFQRAYREIADRDIPLGAKPFCDDANSFSAIGKIPAITHGPNAGGAHTLNEWVSIDDLVRVAVLYALTAVLFCNEFDASIG